MLNAANEVAVAAFLQERLGFTGIPEVIRHTMDAFEHGNGAARVEGLADVRLIDGWATGVRDPGRHWGTIGVLATR